MADQKLTQRNPIDQTSGPDLIHVVKDGVSYKQTKANFLANITGYSVADVSAIWTGSGMIFNVTADAYQVSGIVYNSTPGQVTLDASDATLDRIDLIVAIAPVSPATVGTVGKITGTPASPSVVVPPDYDPSLVYVIKQVLVKASASTPFETVNTQVFDEDVEWDALFNSGNISVTTNDPQTGTKSIEAVNNVFSDTSSFIAPAPVDTQDVDLLTFWIKLKDPVPNAIINVRFWLNGNVVGKNSNSFLVPEPTSTAYQFIKLFKSDFNLPSGTFNKIDIQLSNNSAGYFLDNVIIHQGSGIDASNLISQWYNDIGYVTSGQVNLIKDQFNYNVVNDTEIGTVYTSPVNTKIRELGNVLKSNGFYYLTIGIAGDPYVETNVDLYLMKSADLVTWSNEGLMVSSSEDGWLVEFNGEYYLYCEDKVPNPFTGIKLYKSTDLATWSDEGYVFDKDGTGWEGTDVSSPTIWIDNGTWYMFYEGRNTGTNQWGAIGLATSSDGITWVRDVGNPIISGTNINSDITWSDEIVPDDIFKIGDVYYLTIHGYSAGGWRFGILTSNNLTDWTPLKDTYFDDSAIVSSNMVVYNSENKGFLTFMVNPSGANPFRELVIGRFGIDYTNETPTLQEVTTSGATTTDSFGISDSADKSISVVNTTNDGRLYLHADKVNLYDNGTFNGIGFLLANRELRFSNNSNYYTSLVATVGATSVNTLTLPDASGTIALTSDITGGGDVSKSGTPVGGQVTVWMSDGTVLGKDTFYFNDDSSSAILTVGDSGVKRGNLIIEADPTGSTAGGEINLIIADDYDTSITKYILKAQSDDFVIRDSSSEILRHDYSVSKWKFSQYGDGTKTGTASYSLAVDSSGNIIEEPLIIVSAPATSTSTGIAGQIAYDSSYFYVCTATNTWVRTALATW